MGASGYEIVLYCRRRALDLPTHTLTVVQAWREASHYLGVLSAVAPLWTGDFLKKVSALQGFSRWALIGIEHLGDMWRNNAMIPFEDLQTECALQKVERYRNLRLRHALRSHLHMSEQIQDTMLLEDRILTEPLPEHAISIIDRILSSNSPNPNERLRVAWEEDVGPMDEDEWADVLKSAREVAIWTFFRLVQLWILHWSYLPRVRLQQMGRTQSDLCVRCQGHSIT
ncbi:hypothetical protein NDU88_001245 [Pleurodeles waltl]|uniref:Uncharacterized protein n=1 Tax=Pleurodeles waltl TaxID=8319 RepID=A0AAV7KP20_PLEWA|nr:hypothetical protein NDU88_001245 [Pleurodeles waltl]